MIIPIQYAYLFGVIFLLSPFWFFLFYIRKDLRKEILWSSLFFGFAGPLSQLWYTIDYWHPVTFTGWKIGIEDFLFGFFAGGIASVIYEVLFNKHFIQKRRIRSPYILTITGTSLIAISLFFFTTINSIYIGIFFFFMFGLLVIFYRRDLFFNAFMSGLFGGTIAIFAYVVFLFLFPGIIEEWWKLSNLSGVFLLGIPFEEIIWAFGFGFAAGPSYEFITGKMFERNKKSRN